MNFEPGTTQVGHYLFLERLGTGTFASVWLAIHTQTRLKAAIKVILKSSVLDEDSVTRFTRELNFLRQMRHPFIVEFYEFLEDDSAYYYCMEHAENSSLLRYVTRNGPMTEDLARHYFSQLVSVLEYLHTNLRVCHRDVKAENLLLDRHNNIRVIDFGLSNQFTSSRPLLNTACGSPPYACPEMIRGHPYTQAVDIWSSGVLLYSLMTGLLPFDDDSLQALLTKIVTKEVSYPSFLSASIVDLLRRILTKNPDMRITLGQIREHDWFSQAWYAALFAVHLGERSTEAIVDAELVE
jgi:serine/threonine protein kinase